MVSTKFSTTTQQLIKNKNNTELNKIKIPILFIQFNYITNPIRATDIQIFHKKLTKQHPS